MADKKLNSVSPVTDAAYVYAETSNGDTVKISKADLASVVAGNLPYFRRNAIENGDFNTFTFDGCYLFGAPSENFSNRPIASSMEGMLIVINSFQTHIVQIYIDIQGCVYHFRTCYGGSWRNWVKIN